MVLIGSELDSQVLLQGGACPLLPGDVAFSCVFHLFLRWLAKAPQAWAQTCGADGLRHGGGDASHGCGAW